MISQQRKAWGAALVLAAAAQMPAIANASSTVNVATTVGGSVLTASSANSAQWAFSLASDVSGPVTFAASAKSGGTALLMSQLSLSGTNLASSGTLTQLVGGKSLFLRFNGGLLAGNYTLNLDAAGAGPEDFKVVTSLGATTLGTVTQVPEGEAWALALAGIGMVGLRMSRRRRA